MRKKKLAIAIADPSSPASSSSAARLLPFRWPPIAPPAPPFLRRKPWQPRRILDPGSDLVLKWNRVFLLACLAALFLDPLYFYLQSVAGPACVRLDLNLAIVVTFFRTIADLFYLAHMLLKFRTAFVAPSSRVFGKGELVRDTNQIALRYLKSDFAIDLVALLPIPQIIVWFIIPAVSSSKTHTNNTLALIVLIQYIPRLFLIFPLNARIVKATGVVANTAWAGAAYNLLLYMLASHVLGALWYLLSMERQTSCWIAQCRKEDGILGRAFCNPIFLDCSTLGQSDRNKWLNITQVISKCDASAQTTEFKFGMFVDAFTNDVVSSPFLGKYLYCLWWGLKNLSSYGQGIVTSTYAGETSFCILICIVGLVLFAQLIGNMQTYLQSVTIRLEEWRVRRRDTEEWMRHRQLPPNLQERVRRFVQYKWLATRGVDEESILKSLPLDLRRDIQRHLCLDLVRRVPFFSQMDTQLLDAICERLVSSLSTEGTYIVREDDPVVEMLFVIRGRLESSTTNGGRSGFFNSIMLRPGDFCGEELLTWALMPNPGLNLPSSTRTVRAVEEVEAFALHAEDLKFVANQFKRLHSKKLQHAFRFYSHNWRTWGACLIQAAWRRFKKRRMAMELSRREKYLSHHLPARKQVRSSFSDENQVFTQDHEEVARLLGSIGAESQKMGREDLAASSLKMPKLLKPDEPNFLTSLGQDDGTDNDDDH
ncbi:cyclic nucleotide-gated ion channel 18-like [Wolffia australiana]